MTVYVKPTFMLPNGSALAGGFVYVYESNTRASPKTTYSNSAMTVPNTNPIVLDGNGQANIWFTGSAYYEVFDSNMNLQWTQDNIWGLGSASINIDSTNRTVRNLRSDDDMDTTLGVAADRCGRFIQFDCHGEPALLTVQQLANLLGIYTIGYIDLGWFCCPIQSYVDCGTFEEAATDFIDFGIFPPIACC